MGSIEPVIMGDEKHSTSSHGDFFAVDRRTWALVCALGMNPAVAYLVLARFSQRDNRTTSASVNAIEEYTGIARGRAKDAVAALVSSPYVRRPKDGFHPRYDLVPFEEIERRKQTPTKPEWIWLPNTLVTGAADEVPPLELARQTQDVMILRFLVDLYSAQNLRDDGGIDRKVIRQEYNRHRLGQRAQYAVWGFRASQYWATWGTPVVDVHRREPSEDEKRVGKNVGVDLFARMVRLASLHLIDWIPYVFESSDLTSEPVFPCGGGASSSIEDRIGAAAYRAAVTLLTPQQTTWAQEQGYWLVPLPQHLDRAEMVGVARLRYRPQTRLTSAWYGELQTVGEKWLSMFASISGQASTVGRSATG